MKRHPGSLPISHLHPSLVASTTLSLRAPRCGDTSTLRSLSKDTIIGFLSPHPPNIPDPKLMGRAMLLPWILFFFLEGNQLVFTRISFLQHSHPK